MPDLMIRKFPDPILRKRAKKTAGVGDYEKRVLSDMARTMYMNGGVGLAAVQIGIDRQLAVIDVGEGLVKFVNPEIVKKEGSETGEEGCLSVPDTLVNIKRAKRVTVNFLNESGERSSLVADGLFARAIQHELDHLQGRLIIDHVNPIKRLFFRKKVLPKSRNL
jgi:peptide deformylase